MLTSYLAIAMVLLFGAMSPGPSFLFVSQQALRSRRLGIASALGMGFGGALLALAGLVAVRGLIGTSPTAWRVVSCLGAAYLAYVGVSLWRSAAQSPASPVRQGAMPVASVPVTILAGALVQLANPKTAAVYASLFMGVQGADDSPKALLGASAFVFAIEFGWYAMVALGLSRPSAQRTYLRRKVLLERIAATAMSAFAVALLACAFTSASFRP